MGLTFTDPLILRNEFRYDNVNSDLAYQSNYKTNM